MADAYREVPREHHDGLPETAAYIPVVFLTALDGEEDRRKAFAVGAADYLAKPVQKERLLTKVEEQIKTRFHWQDLKERVVC